MQNLKHFFVFLGLWLFAGLCCVQAKDPFAPLVKVARQKLQTLIAQNHRNDLAGKSHLNQYIVYIGMEDLTSSDDDWFEDKSQKLSPSQKTQLNQMAQAGFVPQANSQEEIPKELQNTRFYIVYINDVPIKLPPNQSLERSYSYSTLLGIDPDLKDSFQVPLSNALQELIQNHQQEDSRFPEQAFLAVGSILIEYANNQTERSFFDYLDTQGEQLKQKQAYQYIQQQLPTDDSDDIYANLSDIVQSFNRSIKAIRLGEVALVSPPHSDVNTADLDQKTAEDRAQNWDDDITSIALSTHQTGHLHLRGFRMPEKEQAALEEKLEFLESEAGINVQLVYYRLNYTIPEDQQQAFLDQVWSHEELRRTEKMLLVVVPVYKKSEHSVLTLVDYYAHEDLYSFPGMRGSEHFTPQKQAYAAAFLSAPFNDLKARVLALYKALPKPYYHYHYFFTADARVLAKRVRQENITNLDRIYHISISYDQRIEDIDDEPSSLDVDRVRNVKTALYKYQSQIPPEDFNNPAQLEADISKLSFKVIQAQIPEKYEKHVKKYHFYFAIAAFPKSAKPVLTYYIQALNPPNAPIPLDIAIDLLEEQTLEAIDILTLGVGTVAETAIDVILASYYYLKEDYMMAGISIGAVLLPGVLEQVAKKYAKQVNQVNDGIQALFKNEKAYQNFLKDIFDIKNTDLTQQLAKTAHLREVLWDEQLLNKIKQFADRAPLLKVITQSQGFSKALLKNKAWVDLWKYFRDHPLIIRKNSVAEFSLEGIQDIGQITLRQNDGITDVFVHHQEGKYWVYLEKEGKFGKSPTAMGEGELAVYLQSKLIDNQDPIRLLSCSDLASAQKLSKHLEGRNIYATDDYRSHTRRWRHYHCSALRQ